MHDAVFVLAVAWLALLMGLLIVVVLRAATWPVRLLALDTLTLVLIALLLVFAAQRQSAAYLDAALALGLLGFTGTVAAARYRATGRVLW